MFPPRQNHVHWGHFEPERSMWQAGHYAKGIVTWVSSTRHRPSPCCAPESERRYSSASDRCLETVSSKATEVFSPPQVSKWSENRTSNLVHRTEIDALSPLSRLRHVTLGHAHSLRRAVILHSDCYLERDTTWETRRTEQGELLQRDGTTLNFGLEQAGRGPKHKRQMKQTGFLFEWTNRHGRNLPAGQYYDVLLDCVMNQTRVVVNERTRPESCGYGRGRIPKDVRGNDSTRNSLRWEATAVNRHDLTLEGMGPRMGPQVVHQLG